VGVEVRDRVVAGILVRFLRPDGVDDEDRDDGGCRERSEGDFLGVDVHEEERDGDHDGAFQGGRGDLEEGAGLAFDEPPGGYLAGKLAQRHEGRCHGRILPGWNGGSKMTMGALAFAHIVEPPRLVSVGGWGLAPGYADSVSWVLEFSFSYAWGQNNLVAVSWEDGLRESFRWPLEPGS